MAFQINHSAAFDTIPEGDYEFVITSCRINATRGGTEYIDVQMTIRNDVAQAQQNRVVYNPIWRAKNPAAEDTACDGFRARDINQLSRAAALENGKSYTGIDEWCADLVGKAVRATVYHDEYNGNVNARVRRMSKTNFPEIQHRAQGFGAAPAAPTQVTTTEENCPF